MFLKNKNIIFKIRRSKVTDYAALNESIFNVRFIVRIGCLFVCLFVVFHFYIQILILWYLSKQ